MTTAIDKIKALAQQVKDTGPDLTKEQTGGGDYVPPAEGATRLRFIRYVEVGIHSSKFQNVVKTKPRAYFTFELSGPKHPAKVLEDGRTIPQTITFKETVGRHAKNGYMKLFKIMAQGSPNATNFIALLNNAYRGQVVHSKSADGKRTYANLKKDGVPTISSTEYEDPDSGEVRTVQVAPALSPLQVFLWDYADLEQWDSLFVDGTYDDGSTKNKVQDEIKRAENFVGSPIYGVLVEAGYTDEQLKPAPKAAPQDGDEPDSDDVPEKAPSKPVEGRKAPAKATPPADDADPLAGVE